MILVISLIVIVHAAINWYIIERMKQRPNHFFHVVIYFVVCSTLIIWFPWLKVLAISATARLAIFDPLLNLMRGKNIDYNGALTPVPERKKSFWDWVENKIGIKTKYLMIAYVIVFILNIFLCGLS